jgi:hypothetical protein
VVSTPECPRRRRHGHEVKEMKRALSRVAVAIVFSGLLVVGAVLPAAADGPVSHEREFNPPRTITGACLFPIEFNVVRMSKWATVWVEPDGTVMEHHTGGGVFTYTNTLMGKAIEVQLHGLIVLVYYPDGRFSVTWTGDHVLGDNPVWAQGRTQWVIGPAPDYQLLSFSTAGRWQDLCEILGP